MKLKIIKPQFQQKNDNRIAYKPKTLKRITLKTYKTQSET